jgi:hypothetical protein
MFSAVRKALKIIGCLNTESLPTAENMRSRDFAEVLARPH